MRVLVLTVTVSVSRRQANPVTPGDPACVPACLPACLRLPACLFVTLAMPVPCRPCLCITIPCTYVSLTYRMGNCSLEEEEEEEEESTSLHG